MDILEKKQVPIDECDFSHRTYNVADKFNIKFLHEFCELTPSEILDVHGAGKFTLREIRKILARYGWCLKGDFLAQSEEERKLIQNVPVFLREIQNQLRDIDRHLRFLDSKLELMHVNMQPLGRE